MKKTTLAFSIAALAFLPMLASADNHSLRASTTSATSTPSATKIACVQNALEKRDSAVIAGHNTFNTSIVSALTARKDGLKNAYALADRTAAKTAKKTVWNTFKSQVKVAHDTMRGVRKTSWSAFNTEMRACGVAHEEAPHAVLNPAISL